MAKLPVHLLRQHYASRCVDLLKMKSLVPRDVECPPHQFKRRLVEVVFDPLRVREPPNCTECLPRSQLTVLSRFQLLPLREEGAALVVALVSMVAHASRRIDQVWPWWAFGIVVGVSVGIGDLPIPLSITAWAMAGFGIGLLRPEVWPFWGLYGLWLAWRDRSSRPLVASDSFLPKLSTAATVG